MLISDCASNPKNIPPSYMSVSYDKLNSSNCAQLLTQLDDAKVQLTEFSEKQNAISNKEIFGLFLLEFPTSHFSGAHEADIARLKGIVEAIETTQIKNNCKTK